MFPGNDKTLTSFITNNLQQTLRNDKVAQVFYRVCVETAVESAFDKSSLAGLGTLLWFSWLFGS